MVNIYIEEIPPIFLCCDTLLTAADIASASRFQHEGRRAEHLAWRRIVRRELGIGTTIEYNDVGAPTVDTPSRYISVAHTKGLIAVAIADRAVGIDIELLERDFEAVKQRFMSDTEIAIQPQSNLWPAMVWTAKEALYKLYGKREMTLNKDFSIIDFDETERRMRAHLADGRYANVEISIKDDRSLVAVATYEDTL